MNVSKRAIIVAFALIAALIGAFGCAKRRDAGSRFHGAIASVDVGRIAEGNDARWLSPQFDDSRWSNAVFYRLKPFSRTFWIRRRTELPARFDDHVLCVYEAAIASTEIYWDGRLIGRGGADDKPGPMDNFFPIPRGGAAPGPHLLAMRVALPAGNSANWFQGIAIGDYEQMLRSRIVAQLLPLAGCGVFIVIGLYYLALFAATTRRASLLVFALLCFSAALLAIAETWRWTVGYTYDWHIVRLTIVSLFTFAVALLLPAYFVYDFRLRRPMAWLLGTAVVLVIAARSSGTFDDGCLNMFTASVAVCGVTIAVAIGRVKTAVIPAAIGTAILTVALLTGGYGFSDNAFFFAFAAVILVLLIAMTIDLRRERREHEGTLLRAARLEIALLQKSIQPHFVMNTLTAAMEWIEQSPEEGVRFLEAFAGQLRIFAEVSADVSIPMAREIALCRAHLMVMSGRKGTRFSLQTNSVDETAPVPPAIFHTLIENAITHNQYAQTDVVFALREERRDHLRRYVLDAPRTRQAAVNGDGTGLRYVKARLEENYPGRWSYAASASEENWTTTIEVPV
ncbi:MAG TPA: histidine kinase [Thermoanaerobaculia bacterium]|jgi:hypothetical protein|nr:histidine kinase [Thermoanaerobaculia bacterium]